MVVCFFSISVLHRVLCDNKIVHSHMKTHKRASSTVKAIFWDRILEQNAFFGKRWTVGSKIAIDVSHMINSSVKHHFNVLLLRTKWQWDSSVDIWTDRKTVYKKKIIDITNYELALHCTWDLVFALKK